MSQTTQNFSIWKLYENLTYVRMRPAAIALNYSVKDIRNDVHTPDNIYEKLQFNRLAWGSQPCNQGNHSAAKTTNLFLQW